MNNYTYSIIARMLHVAGVVLWIGGVAFVTTVLIPSLRGIEDGRKRLELFETLESRFGFQAKIIILITGLSGFYMVQFFHAWDRYLHLEFWWMHLMTLVWLFFAALLFALEPLFLHRWFHRRAIEDSDEAFRFIHIAHILLLSLSLAAIGGAVAGVHGF